jgi:hypothetical protein
MTERVRLIVSPANEVQMVIVSESDTEDCSICLENTTENDTQLICGHIFHNECLHEWLDEHTTCPVCRAILPILETKSPHITVDLELPDSTDASDRVRTNRAIMFKLFALKTMVFFTFFVNYYAVQIIEVNSYGVDVLALLVVVEVALLYWGSYLLYKAWKNFR